MCIKRIASVVVILLGYIAVAGAAQKLIQHFSSKPAEERYAEMRIAGPGQMQVLICKDWAPDAEDSDDASGGHSSDVVQDIYYWIDLQANGATTLFTNSTVHANGPVAEHPYHGSVKWDVDHQQLTVNLYRPTAKVGKTISSMPFPANGTYAVRKVTRTPFLSAASN